MAAKFELGAPTQRDYGYQTQGYVVSEQGNDIPITLHSPYPDIDQLKDREDNPTALVMANGLFTGRNSMDIPAIEAARAGKTVATFDYTNHRAANALQANADDMAYVFDALPDHRLVTHEGLGLSMGGAVLALTLAETSLNRATFVSPAGFIERLDKESAATIATHFGEQFGREIVHERLSAAKGLFEMFSGGLLFSGALKDWEADWRCAGSSVQDMIGRRAAVQAQLRELISGVTVHDEFRKAMAQPDAPISHLYYADRDVLIPREPLLEATDDLPFTTREEYRGGLSGHTRFIHDPALAAHIFENERAKGLDEAA